MNCLTVAGRPAFLFPMSKMQEYWQRGRDAYAREMKKYRAGKRDKVEDKWPYVAAVAARCAQKSGFKKHQRAPLARHRKSYRIRGPYWQNRPERAKAEKTGQRTSESFENRVDNAINEVVADFGPDVTPMIEQSDLLAFQSQIVDEMFSAYLAEDKEIDDIAVATIREVVPDVAASDIKQRFMQWTKNYWEIQRYAVDQGT